MKSFEKSTMKTVVWVSFSLFILLQSPNVQGAGTCGPAAGQNYIAAPEGRLSSATLCTAGTFADSTDDSTYWKWKCGTKSCQAYKVTCGTGNGATLPSVPTGTGLCNPSGINDTSSSHRKHLDLALY